MKVHLQRMYDNGKYLLTLRLGLAPERHSFIYAEAVVDDFGDLYLVTGWM